jgi:hypothetical protein
MKRTGDLILACLALAAVTACNLYQVATQSTATLTPVAPTSTPTVPTSTPTVPSSTPTIPSPTPTALTPTATSPLLIHQIHGPLLIKTVLPLPQGKLDYMANANYGEANLSAGFAPEPYSVGMTSGGNVDVSYLGSSCMGFTTSAPDLRVNYGGGGASLLRIYFVASANDATMVINDPYGNFYCVDDSFGTMNPTIDFNNPAGGTYDIWIGSYASNANISGTLYLTENSGNHP